MRAPVQREPAPFCAAAAAAALTRGLHFSARAAEIIILDGLVTVYRNSSDVWLYVVGSQSENELILVNVLTTLYDSLSSLVGRGERTRRSRRRRPLPARLLTPRARPRVQLRSLPDKRVCLDNFDTLLLTIDEMVDAGMILETEASAVVNRVGMKAADAAPPEGTFSESGLNTMLASAREQLARSLLK